MATTTATKQATNFDMAPGTEVVLYRDRFGYKVGPKGTPKKECIFLRRVTTYTGALPKGWLGPWAANTSASFVLSHWPKIVAMLADIDHDEIVTAGQAFANKAEPKKNGNSALIQSAYELIRKSPWEKRDAAGDRGSAIHAAIEAFIADEPMPDILTTEDELACAIAAETYLKARPHLTIKHVETTVISFTHAYAGTFDLFAEENGETSIEDWKSSSAVHVDHAVQQLAYDKAEWAVVDKQEIKTRSGEGWTGRLVKWKGADHLRIVHVTPEKATPMEIRQEAKLMLWNAFKCAKWMYEFQRDTDDYRSPAKVAVFG